MLLLFLLFFLLTVGRGLLVIEGLQFLLQTHQGWKRGRGSGPGYTGSKPQHPRPSWPFFRAQRGGQRVLSGPWQGLSPPFSIRPGAQAGSHIYRHRSCAVIASGSYEGETQRDLGTPRQRRAPHNRCRRCSRMGPGVPSPAICGHGFSSGGVVLECPASCTL